MPELPEVETVRRILEPQLVGRLIVGVDTGDGRAIAYPTAAEFAAGIKGAGIMAVRRRGKFLLVELTNGRVLACHLRMTGQLLAAPQGWPETRYTRVVFRLEDGGTLRFADMRRFGRLWLAPAGEIEAVAGMGKLGLEPFDAALTPGYLREKLGKRNVTVKQALLDQSVVAGIGNIYADETLHRAELLPGTKTAGLPKEAWQKLAGLIPEVLHEAIEQKKLTPEEYLRTEGREYRTEPFLRVYGRTDQPCQRCGTSIERVTIGGRGSHFCPKCQN